MTEYYDGQITDILPHSLEDDDAVQAMSYAIREGTRILNRYTQQCYVYCSIDTMPDDVLDLLAVELRTQYYSQDMDIETKRALLRNTLIWYMTAGTPEAVEELVTTVFGEGTVEEWWEYGADPYWFRILTDAPLGEDVLDYFSTMIKRVKNTRSHIGSIEVSRIVKLCFFSGVGGSTAYHPAAIIDGHSVEYETDQNEMAGIGRMEMHRAIPITEGN